MAEVKTKYDNTPFTRIIYYLCVVILNIVSIALLTTLETNIKYFLMVVSISSIIESCIIIYTVATRSLKVRAFYKEVVRIIDMMMPG